VPRLHDHVLLWGSLPSCAPIENRRARRLATAAQDDILPRIAASRKQFFGVSPIVYVVG
jgi:hypothetical protein